MTRSELIHIVAAQKPHLYHSEVGRIVDTVLEEIAAALEHGGRVELRGFGALSVRHRPSRSARNPKNGQSVSVEEKWVPFFKIGKDLHDRLNSRQTQY